MPPTNDNVIKLIVEAVDKASQNIDKINKRLDALGSTAAKQTASVGQLESGLGKLEGQMEKTTTAAGKMQDSLLSIRNLYFLSFLYNNITHHGGELVRNFAELSTGAAQWAREMKNVQVQFGFTNLETVGLEISLKTLGRSVGDIDQGLRMFTLRMYEASRGSGYGADMMRKLGFNMKEMKEIGLLPTGQALDRVIARMQELQSTAERNTVAVMAFGRSAVTMMPLVEEGLQTGREQAQQFEVQLSELESLVGTRALFAFREMSMSLEAMGRHFGILQSEFMTPFATAIGQLAQAMSRHLRTAVEETQVDMGGLAGQVDKVTSSVTALIAKLSEYAAKKREADRNESFTKDTQSTAWWMMFTSTDDEKVRDQKIIDYVKSRINEYRNQTEGKNLGIGPNVFEGVGAGPGSSIDTLLEVDASFEEALAKIDTQVRLHIINLQQAVDQLQTLMKQATTAGQRDMIYGTMSRYRDVEGGTPNPFYGNVTTPYGTFNFPGSPKNIPNNIGVPGLNYLKPGFQGYSLTERGFAMNDPALKDSERAASVRNSLLKAEDPEKLIEKMDLLHTGVLSLIADMDDWFEIVEKCTDAQGTLNESTLAFVAGIENVRRNLYLGGNEMYDFAYRLARGIADALDDGFQDIYTMMQKGTLTLKNGAQTLINALINNVHRELIRRLSLAMTDAILRAVSGARAASSSGGGGFGFLGMLAPVIGLINPVAGVIAALGTQVIGGMTGTPPTYNLPGTTGGTVQNNGSGPAGPGGYSQPGNTYVPPPYNPSPAFPTISAGSRTTSPAYTSPNMVNVKVDLQVNGGLFDVKDLGDMVTDTLIPAIAQAQAEGRVRTVAYGS